MHQNITFLIVANQNNISLKMSWAEKLIKSYQNSTAIVTLIAKKKMKLKPLTVPSIRVIHYPANRDIDIHLILIQMAKLLKNSQLCYIHHGLPVILSITPETEPSFYGFLEHNKQVVGIYLDCNRLLSTMKMDINTTNSIRRLMLASGLK